MIDNTPYHLKSWQELYKRYGKGELDPAVYYKDISGVRVIDTVRKVFAGEYDEAGLQKIADEKEAIYRELYAPFLRPINGLENFLTELKGAGIKIAMATSSGWKNIDFVLDKVPVRDDFSVIIDGSRVSRGKPDPEIFLKAARDVKARAEDCVVFEDSLAGIQAANAAGMKVVAITTGHKAEQLQPSNLVINDYTGLTVQMIAELFEKD